MSDPLLAAPVHNLRMAALLSSLRTALDLMEGQPVGHSIRCCWIGVQIGQKMGLDSEQIRDLYYTLLLKDLGWPSTGVRIFHLYLREDENFGSTNANLDSLLQAVRFILPHTGLQVGLSEGFDMMVKSYGIGGDGEEASDTRCRRGADIAKRLRFSKAVAEGIRHIDEHWEGSGRPLGLRGRDIPLYSRIALLAQTIDVFHDANGFAGAIAEVRRRNKTWFDPDLVGIFEDIASWRGFWSMLRSRDLESAVFALEPAQHMIILDETYLDDIATAFAQMIDAKSPFTFGHSERVTFFTDLIAKQLGLDHAKRRWLRRAALLHDIGKLGVSNAVLNKPGKLNAAEWRAVRMHPVHSENILSQAAAFADVAPLAGAHHERLDGKGYPRGLRGDEITLETRILTMADIFDALSADRPYRPAMTIPTTLEIMTDMAGTAIDRTCFDALKNALHENDIA